ncbi:FtsX-like permease family protein [Porticoccaceae bacterium]|jgi:lipoprotein-releasing system permease protein|nr:FtsX-like permease family protein [Porticoccaceae bacterium]MDB4108885.1 FtsX-like permease family protein [Porticoccaceae bacterium]MDC1476552.1 FtsX-like permease family protein [Porticoccaceae bacterium]
MIRQLLHVWIVPFVLSMVVWSLSLFKSVPLFIGLRYFTSGGQGNRLVSFISMLAITGLALGVALLVIVLSVMNGFDRELRERILSVVPHVQLIHGIGVTDWQTQQTLIEGLDQVSEVTPYNEAEGLIHSRQKTRPLQLLGLSAESLPSGLQAVLNEGNLSVPGANELLLSQPMAEDLNVVSGQRVTVIIPSINGSKTAAYSFVVKGLFSTHTELDQLLGLASLEQVGDIAGVPGMVQGFRLQVDDQFNAREIGYKLLEQLPFGYGFRDWFQTHGNLYQAIQLSRNMVGLLIFLIVAIAAFNVVSMLMMSVVSKRKDIAVLQTLGLSRGQLLKVFLIQGAMIGLFGIALGVLLGVLGCYWVADLVLWVESLLGASFLDTAVYPIDYVPVDLRWADVLQISTIAFMLNLLATIYPALRASRMVPAQELRFES